MNKTVKGIECKFAIHIPTKHPDIPDTHLIKEAVHYDDGSIEPNVRFVKNFKRKFWITKPNKRNHTQKKEWESLDNLLEKECTQSDLRYQVAKLLDKGWSKDSLKQLSSSPYLYGTEISSTSLIKKMYMDKYPNLVSAYSNATFDIETDVVNGTEDIIMATIIFKDKIYTAVDKSFLNGFSLVNDRFKSMCDKYIGDYISKRNMQVELYIAEDPVDIVRSVFNKAHEWKPDFLSIWNMDFDINRVLQCLKKYKVDPLDVLCDPSVPRELRICNYREGSKKKTTASGQVKPKSPAEQWHTLELTASFYVIDAMCSYKQIRSQQQEEQSYSLDAILNKELGIRKLKFVEADEYSGLKWHQVMQSRYKFEYIVYNIFDSLSMIELDDKIKDISFTLPAGAATSDFSKFNSQPKRIADALHFFCLERGFALGTIGYSNKPETEDEEEEDESLGLRGWIVTLPAHLTTPGLNCILEDPTIRTNIRAFIFDSDEVSAYPTAISVANVSKYTTLREVISIDGVSEATFRMQNINLLLGHVNAIEYSTTMFNMPKEKELLKEFMNQNN